MDIAHKEYKIKPLQVKITLSQNDLLFPFSDLGKKIRSHYDQFMAEMETFKQILNQSTRSSHTVMSYGFLMAQSLQTALKGWQDRYSTVRALSFTPQSLKSLEKTDAVYGNNQCQFSLFCSKDLEVLSMQDKPLQWAYDHESYQGKILMALWQLKWVLYAEWNSCLNQIDCYNRNKNSESADYYAPIQNPAAKEGVFQGNPLSVMVELNELLRNYVKVFTLHYRVAPKVASEFEALGQATTQTYQYSRDYTKDNEGASPAICGSRFKKSSDFLLVKLNDSLKAIRQDWLEIQGFDEGVIRFANDALQARIPLKSKLQVTPEARQSFYPLGSFDAGLENVLLKGLYEVDQKVYVLLQHYARAIYLWNLSKLLRRLKLNSQGSLPNEFMKRLVEEKAAIEAWVEKTNNGFSEIIRGATSITQKRCTISEATGNFIKGISSVRCATRKTYSEIAGALNNLSKALTQGGDILEVGPHAIRALRISVAESLQDPSTEVIRVRDKLNSSNILRQDQYYWAHEQTMAKEVLAHMVLLEKTKIKNAWRGLPRALYVINNEILGTLLDLSLEGDDLYYRCLGALKADPMPADILKHAGVFEEKIEALTKKFEIYESLFTVTHPVHLTVMNKLLDLKQYAWDGYQHMEGKSRHALFDIESQYECLSHLKESFQRYQSQMAYIRSPEYRTSCLATAKHTQSRFFGQLAQKISVLPYEKITQSHSALRSLYMKNTYYIALNAWHDVVKMLESLLRGFSMFAVEKNYEQYHSRCQTESDLFMNGFRDMLSTIDKRLEYISTYIEKKRGALDKIQKEVGAAIEKEREASEAARRGALIESYTGIINGWVNHPTFKRG